ncbi:hypothetical protein LDENG_00047760 [Lucifuga dentata]|nr:hypothetical protein LDENG_00047760 [Lucifuga dentata]
MLSEVKKNPRVTAKGFKESLEQVNISVHESTTCKKLNRHGVHSRTPRRKPLLSKKIITACLKFAKEHLDPPQHYWENVLWTDETKVELLGKNMQHYENIIPTLKYGGGSIMIWGCFAASGPGLLAIIEGKVNSQVYQGIVQDNLKLSRSWVMQ